MLSEFIDRFDAIEDRDGIFELNLKKIRDAIKFLKKSLDYHFLVDITAIDYLEYLEEKPKRLL